MGLPVTIKNAVDSWVDHDTPNDPRFNTARLHLRSDSAGSGRNAYLYFNRAWPAAGATIISAKLRLWNGDAFSLSTTLSVQRCAVKWSSNTISWNRQPTLTGAIATQVKATAAAGEMWDIDVTALVQTVASGGAWFGFKVTSNNANNRWVHASESSSGHLRPLLLVEWSEAPEEPEDLKPAGNRVVSLQRPTLSYDFSDLLGDTNQAAQQIQFGSSEVLLEAGTTTFDTGESATSESEYDTSVGTSRIGSVTTTNASPSITSPAAPTSGAMTFAASDVGMGITGVGIPVGATILSVQSATAATLSVNATASGTDAAASITRIWPGLVDAAGTWWRVKVKDGAGLWSLWSDAVQFRRLTKGVLTITSPTGGAFYDLSPTVTWTFTGRTQRAYQVAVSRADDPGDWIWDSGKITSTATSVNIPFGVFEDLEAAYIFRVFVWDTEDREATPDDTMYVAASTASSTIQYDPADAKVVNLAVVTDPLYPHATLTWDRSGAVLPIGYVIQRSIDGGATWKAIDEDVPEDLLVSGVQYTYKDFGPPTYTALTWRVIPIAASNGRMTSGNPTVSGQVRRLAPFLCRPNGTDIVCFLNPKRRREFDDLQELVTTIGGKVVLVTQRLGKRRGEVGGRLTGEAITGVTADVMLARFLRLRRDSGQTMFVSIANETIKCVAWNFQYEPLTDASGITYEASFEWAEL